MVQIQPQALPMLTAVTTTTTSAPIATNGSNKSIMLVASSVTSGNGVFTVQISNDGINFVDYNRLTTNVTNTNAQTDTRVASVTLSTNTSNFLFFPTSDVFSFFRTRCTITTDGVYTAVAYVS